MQGEKLYLILHDIRSAYNVGAIFRSADGAGVSKVYLTGYTPLPPMVEKEFKTKAEKMIEKTALGAELSVEWEYNDNLEELLGRLKKDNCNIVALEKTIDAIDVNEYETENSTVLILGNEVDGVSEDVLIRCDAVVSIPMRGAKESLNVSVAAGIAMYALLK